MRTLLRCAAAACWMLTIYALSSVPGSMLGAATFWSVLLQKIGHVVLFGVLSVLYLRVFTAFSSEPAVQGIRPFLLSLGATVVYALSDEFHQMLVPGRIASWKDVLLDAAGAVLFLSLFHGMTRIYRDRMR